MLPYTYAAEITSWNGAATVVTYVSSVPFASAPGDTPAHTIFEPRLVQPAWAQRDAFDAAKTSGRSAVGYGNIVLKNDDGALDFLLTNGVDARPLIVRRGLPGAAYPAGFTTIFKGTMQNVVSDGRTLTIKTRDQQATIAVPFQPVKYAGTNVLPNGLEGTAADLQGKPKVVVLGVVKNAPIPCVNTDKLIYHLSNGPVASLDAIYDRGIAITAYGGAYATLADLQDDAQDPSPGSYKVYGSATDCYVRLGSQPAGQITADMTNGNTAAERTAAHLFVQCLTRAGKVTGDWNAADIVALDAVAPGPTGIYVDSETTCDVVADQFAATPLAWWGPDNTGVIRIQQLTLPSGAPVVSFVQDDCIGGPPQQLLSNDPADGLPSCQTVLQFEKNYTVQTVDFLTAALLIRARVIGLTGTAMTVRVAVADNYPQGTNTATIAYQDQGSGGCSPASGQTVSPQSTLTESAGTYVDFTISYPAFGAPARVTFTVTAANRQAATDGVDVPATGGAKAVTYSNTAPTSPAVNDLWLDTSTTPNVWKRWSGAAWVPATPTTAAQITYTGGATVDSLKPAEVAAEQTTGKSMTVLLDRTAQYINYLMYGNSVESMRPAQAQATGDGFQILTNPDFLGGTNPFSIYDNSGPGSVSHTIEADSSAPNSSGYRLKITALAGGVYSTHPNPGWGGFYAGIGPDGGAFAANSYHRGSTIIWRVRAKIPVGMGIQWASNNFGDGGTADWLTAVVGTGDWCDYVLRQVIGSTNAVQSWSSTGFFYLSGTGSEALPVSWYIAVCTATCVTHPGGRHVRDVDPNQRAIIDLSQGGHLNKTVDNVADGGTYARTKSSELSGGQVKQLLDTVESLTLTSNQQRREAIMYGQVL